MEKNIEGIIFKIESKDFYLYNAQFDKVRCSLKGRFQKEYELKKDKLYAVDIAAVGDRVKFEINKDGTGVINEIYPRRNYISRKAPRIKGAGTRGERLEQIVASNIDNLIIVGSCNSPKFNNRLIDRLLVAAESSNLHSIIVINKTDLDHSDKMFVWSDLYTKIGYDIIMTSIVDKTGIDQLKNVMHGKINLIWGQSGVGKSSLLNIIYAGLNLKTGIISVSTSKGKHTTVTSIMNKIDADTYVIDTPGIREIDPYGIRKEDVGHYFKDFALYSEKCRFNTCTHNHEPECAVMEAVRNGAINFERYQSYLNILESIEDDMNF